MKTYTFKLESNQVLNILDLYKNYSINKNIQHALKSFFHNGNLIVVYKSNTVLIQGENVVNEVDAIKEFLGMTEYSSIGSDEVGTGDFFGPICVCSCYVDVSDLDWLNKLQIKDSKKISDAIIIKVAPILAKRLTYSLQILEPTRYNNAIRSGYNMNRIKAVLHNKAILTLINKINIPNTSVILDQFCLPNKYFEYLNQEKTVFHNINFQTKAENYHISVACASIIARYSFLQKLDQYSKDIGFSLQKGAGPAVDGQIAYILKQIGVDQLSSLGKLNFKNYTKQK